MTLYCKDCEFCELIPPRDNVDYSKCNHPFNHVDGVLSPVTGLATKPFLPYCENERAAGNRCGITAKRFLPNTFYAEYLRDLAIESREEARREQAQPSYRDEGRSEPDFERDSGARP